MSEPLQLSEFPPASREAWLRRVERVLNGQTFEALRSRTADEIVIDPLYEPVDAGPIAARGAGEPWRIVQRVDHPEPAQANEIALEDAGNGATGLALTFRGAASARGFGLREHHARAIATALRDLPLHMLQLRLEAGAHAADASEALRDVLAARSVNPERANVYFGLDPLGAMAARGTYAEPWTDMAGQLAALAGSLGQEFPGPFVEADGRIYHDGGGSEGQELGAALATAVAYLRAIEGTLTDAKLAGAIGMTLAADADLFTGMAKFRAARLLWSELLPACQLPQSPLKLHAETSWRMMTRRDPHGNLLRNVAAIFAAGLGGADSVCALPFSLAAGLPDRFARRMARNAHLILIEEAKIHQVGDPAAGSGYVEHLARSIAETAWDFFQTIERRGGMAEALRSGFVAEEIRKSQERRRQQIATGATAIVGVTKFANAHETLPSILAVDADFGSGEAEPMGIRPKRDAEDSEFGSGER